MPRFADPIDLAQNELQNAKIQNLASPPGNPVDGQPYYDTGLGQFGVFTASGWTYLGASSTGTVTQAGNSASAGIMKVSAGANIAITDYAGGVGLLKSSASGVVSPAVAGTDYAVPTSGSSILKGDGSGGFAPAVSSTDYAPATSGSAILKGNGSGGFSSAAAGTDYLAPTGSGASLTGLTQSQISGLSAALALLAPLASPTFTGHVTVPTPSSSTDAVTKAYADAIAQGLSVKPAVRLATTGTETFTITAGSVTQITGTLIDGITPAVGNRILIKDAPAATGAGSANSTQPSNGIYSVTSNTTNLAVSRVADMTGTNAPAGAFTFVEAGNTSASAGFVVSAPSSSVAFTYGTTAMAWTQFSGAGEITAGTGLAKSGNVLSLSTPVSVANGGTGGASQSAARTNLGLGTAATQDTSAFDSAGSAAAAQTAAQAFATSAVGTETTRAEAAEAALAPLAGASFTGNVSTTGTFRSSESVAAGVVTITYAATITPVATAGNHFRCTLTGNVTLNAPTGGLDGQKITVELLQDATGGRTLTLGTGFGLGTDITTVTLTTTANTRDYLALIFNATSGNWDVVGLVHGYS